jgi:hypothetical protein
MFYQSNGKQGKEDYEENEMKKHGKDCESEHRKDCYDGKHFVLLLFLYPTILRDNLQLLHNFYQIR